nr:MAG TPA: hypothetical protein [Caudoviricetes sp.]
MSVVINRFKLFADAHSVFLCSPIKFKFIYVLYHNLARLTTAENPDIFRVVQYIMLCKAGEIGGN